MLSRESALRRAVPTKLRCWGLSRVHQQAGHADDVVERRVTSWLTLARNSDLRRRIERGVAACAAWPERFRSVTSRTRRRRCLPPASTRHGLRWGRRRIFAAVFAIDGDGTGTMRWRNWRSVPA